MQSENRSGISMNVTREVIADLLPLYAAGEASPQTCALVEEYLRQDEEMSQQFNLDGAGGLTGHTVPALPPDLAMKSFKKTRGILRWQRRLYGWAIGLTIASLGGVGFFDGGHFTFHLFMREYPRVFVPVVSLALSCWINYFFLLWRSRASRL
jgi:hypothetical protein